MTEATETPVQAKAHTADIETLKKALLDNANERGYGEHFVDMVKDLNKDLDVKFPEAILSRKAHVSFTFTIDASDSEVFLNSAYDTGLRLGEGGKLKTLDDIMAFLQKYQGEAHDFSKYNFDYAGSQLRWLTDEEMAAKAAASENAEVSA